MSEEDRDYTEEASRQGWKDGGELDAQAFVEKGEKIAGIQKKHNTELKGRIERLEKSNREFGEYQSGLLQKEKQKSADLLVELEAKRAVAINDGDGQAFNQLDSEIAKTRNEINAPDPRQITPEQWGQMTEAWLGENDWYKTNPKLQTYADGLQAQISGEGYTGVQYYQEVTRRIKETFPEEFTNPNQAKANGVESGGTQQTESKVEHSYDNLDKEGKEACDRFVADGLTTVEDYVATYDWP